jgi:catechol 2,3-dioxygenase-like lactoylglutathione lyase family enzyme
MLRDAKHIVPTLPVTDLERSKKFYRDTLGLSEIRRDNLDGGVDYGNRGGPQLHIFPKPGIKASGNTMAIFFVDDLEATVKDIKRRGVTFEHFDMPGVTWEGDIAVMANDKTAWFKDPDGHWLAVGTERV